MEHPWSPQLFAAQAKKLGRSKETIDAAVVAGNAIKNRNADLPVVWSLSHLAHLTGTDPKLVHSYVTRNLGIDPYRVFRLKKRPKEGSRAPTRGFRTICVPEPELMRLQRWIAQNILSRAIPHQSSFAFFRDRGILKAAERHCGCRWLVKIDIHSFFDGIKERNCYHAFRSLGYGALISFELARICTRAARQAPFSGETSSQTMLPYRRAYEGYLPQGAPTSPALANMVMNELDARLSARAEELGWIYTRYADDLAFSTREESNRKEARKVVALAKAEVSRCGFELNESKTVIAPPGARRVVLGLLVDNDAPRLTRGFRNNLETHLHALTKVTIGPDRHRRARGFDSLIGMRRHIGGLLAFAHYVDPAYAAKRYAIFNTVQWPL